MGFNKTIYRFQYKVFTGIIYISWVLYILIALGLSANAPEYLYILNSVVKIYVSLFLIIRFNPFRRVKFTELDAKIAFSAGVFLIATTTINTILQHYLSNITHYLPKLNFT
jgi:hypothetical protein